MAKYWIILCVINKSEQARHRTPGVEVKALIKVQQTGTLGFLCWINPNACVRISSTALVASHTVCLCWLGSGVTLWRGSVPWCSYPPFRSIFSGVCSLARYKEALQTGDVQLHKHSTSVSCLVHTKHGNDLISYRPPLVRNPRSLCHPLGNI